VAEPFVHSLLLVPASPHELAFLKLVYPTRLLPLFTGVRGRGILGSSLIQANPALPRLARIGTPESRI